MLHLLSFSAELPFILQLQVVNDAEEIKDAHANPIPFNCGTRKSPKTARLQVEMVAQMKKLHFQPLFCSQVADNAEEMIEVDVNQLPTKCGIRKSPRIARLQVEHAKNYSIFTCGKADRSSFFFFFLLSIKVVTEGQNSPNQHGSMCSLGHKFQI